MSSYVFCEWIRLQANIDRVIDNAVEPFHPAMVGNTRDLIDLLWGRFAVPEVTEGDRKTVCLDWQTTNEGPLRIEVFSDRLEVYHLDPTFDVWCELHQPGQFFSGKFITM